MADVVPAAAAATVPVVEEFVKGHLSQNGVAVITLDRPKALNALNLEMVRKYRYFLDEWEHDPTVKCILVESSSSRAFAAGGDLKQVLSNWSSSKGAEIFTAVYSLICKIHEYPKPYICLLDATSMGLGIGLSVHGHFRIITEKALFAMPENAIGLFPDVGFAYASMMCPGEGAVGFYVGITGKRISSPADALFIGLGSHYVPSAKIADLKESLLNADLSTDPQVIIEKLLSSYHQEAETESQLKSLLPQIISCFSPNKTIPECIEELKKCQSSNDLKVTEWATEALSGLEKGAPFSLVVTQKHFHLVAAAFGEKQNSLSKLNGVMKAEYRVSVRLSDRKDFYEGIRSLLVDKKHNTNWDPPTLESVDDAEVNSVFEPLADGAELPV